MVFGTFGDPAFEGFLLRRAQGFVRVLGRHLLVFVVGEDAGDECAFVRLAKNDGEVAGLGGLQGILADMEAEAGFAVSFVGAVTVEAFVREDRADVAIELDLRVRGAGVIEQGERGGEETASHRGDRGNNPAKGFNVSESLRVGSWA